MVANDRVCADKIKLLLNEHPPNERARFFDFSVDKSGISTYVLWNNSSGYIS